MSFNFDDIFVLIFILATLYSVISGAGKSMGKAQEEARRRAELQRRRAEAEAGRLEADPARQSYEGYLRRTNQPDVDVFGNPIEANATADTGQDSLRRAMAEKMGRPVAPPSNPSARSLAEDLRDAQGRGTRSAPPRQQPPRQQPQRPVPARPIQRTATSQDGRSLEGPAQRPTSLEVMTSDMRSNLESSTRESGNLQSERARSDVEAVRAARDAMLDRAAGGAGAAGASAARRGIGDETPAAQDAVRRGTVALEPRDIVRAFVMSEILGPPRSRRNGGPR